MQRKHIQKPFTKQQLRHILNYGEPRERRLAHHLLDLMQHIELAGKRRQHGD